jgi:hypothetical protein
VALHPLPLNSETLPCSHLAKEEPPATSCCCIALLSFSLDAIGPRSEMRL